MTLSHLLAFLPELVLFAGALILFVISLGESRGEQARAAALATAVVFIAACVASLGENKLLFSGAYQVDAFSQLLKLIFGIGFLLVVLAGASMLYGNLIALAQTDFKRLLGFSAIAHAGYAMIGFVALSPAGYAAALFYMTGYLFMIVACFAVIGRVSRDGANVAIGDLAGLHRRAPLLAATLAVGVFGLAGVPPFAGFMGKLTLLKCALDQGHLALVILAVVNTAIAIYYYLQVIREAYFKDAVDATPIPVCAQTKFLCAVLITGTILLGVVPGPILDRLSAALAAL